MPRRGEPLEVNNVSRSIHRAGGSNKDLMPCVTPGGAFWVEQAQRVICPLEKFVFQGLPIHRMDVGVLSDYEMASMAGNATHTWVLLRKSCHHVM